MAKGENIFRRRDGRWEARYIKGRELSGKIKYGYCYGKTYREAKEKVDKCKATLASGNPLPTSRTQNLFSTYCLGWLHAKKSKVKEATYIKYSTIVEKHITPKLGACCPFGFTTELMDDFIKELQFEDELAPKTVHDILVVLHGILKFTASKVAGTFPTVEINYPKIGKKEMRVLSREEQERFISYLQKDLDPCRFGILLALCTGIRIGELCALRWECVSIRDKAIRIAETLQRLRDTSVSQNARTRIVIGPPKSDTSVRTIPMTEYAVRLCRYMDPQSSAAYVLTGTETFMEPRVLQYRLEKYTQACGLEGVHFHTLRHTFATRAVEVGFEIKTLSEILGHASVTITLDRYVHSSFELKRNNMQKLNAVGM
jgi:integrase